MIINPLTAPIKIGHINVRGLATPEKITAIHHLTRDFAIDLLILTETWHTPYRPETTDHLYLQTDPDEVRSEGIMILATKKNCCQIQPIFPECWGKRHLLAIVHFKDGSDHTRRLIIQAHYSNPRGQDTGDRDLDFLHRNLRAKYPRELILIAGDFNRSPEDMLTRAILH